MSDNSSTDLNVTEKTILPKPDPDQGYWEPSVKPVPFPKRLPHLTDAQIQALNPIPQKECVAVLWAYKDGDSYFAYTSHNPVGFEAATVCAMRYFQDQLGEERRWNLKNNDEVMEDDDE